MEWRLALVASQHQGAGFIHPTAENNSVKAQLLRGK
jgi:hypothetical protein